VFVLQQLRYVAIIIALAVLAGTVAADTSTQGEQAPPVSPYLLREGPLAEQVVREVELKPSLVLLSPRPNEEWLEGSEVTLRWLYAGPIRTVRLYYYGELTRLGGRSRGTFSSVIADKVPNTGQYKWTVPWMDGASFVLRMAGFDEHGKLVAETERGVNFRAKPAGGKTGTFIVVSKQRQRLWYYRDNRLKWTSIVSTAAPGYTTPDMRPGSGGRRGAMGRVFSKTPDAFSRMYQVHMLWWMAITSSGSHGIHATSPNFYSRLGRPASHGCIRQHRADAQELYSMVSVGTPVYVE
jgi:hypothetical protein